MGNLSLRILSPVVLLILLVLLAAGGAGCGDERVVTISQPEGLENTQTRIYDTSPESTAQLLQDAGAVIETNTAPGRSVHFVMDSRTAGGGEPVVSKAEGDMVFPDRVKMTVQNYSGSKPVPVEVVSISDKVYSRSEASNWIWSSVGGIPPVASPQSITKLIDYARSSRNFGEESLAGNRKTYHVQLDIDTALAADEARKQNADPATIKVLEAWRTSRMTVDLWLGISDLIIYQEKIQVSNPAAGSTSDQNYIFSAWGLPVEINKPCEAC